MLRAFMGLYVGMMALCLAVVTGIVAVRTERLPQMLVYTVLRSSGGTHLIEAVDPQSGHTITVLESEHVISSVVVSPSGQFLSYFLDRGTDTLWVHDTSGKAYNLGSSNGIFFRYWSDIGLYFFERQHEDQDYALKVSNGRDLRYMPGRFVTTTPLWPSPDGSYLLFENRDHKSNCGASVCVMSIDDATPKPFEPNIDLQHVDFAWTSDSEYVYMLADFCLWKVEIAQPEQAERLTCFAIDFPNALYLKLYARETALVAGYFSSNTTFFNIPASPNPRIEEVPLDGRQYSCLAPSQNGLLMAGDGGLAIWEDGHLVLLMEEYDIDHCPYVTADERHALFMIDDNVYRYTFETDELTQLTYTDERKFVVGWFGTTEMAFHPTYSLGVATGLLGLVWMLRRR